MIAVQSSLLIFGSDKNQNERLDAKNISISASLSADWTKRLRTPKPSGFALRRLASARQANPIATFNRWAAFGA